jgi:hypothetical protein
MTEEGFELQLRLADPARAAKFVAAHRSLEAARASSSVIPYLETWQRRSESHSDLDILAGTLFAAGALIAILTIATASVLIAGRMAAQVRQVGTLKAVGGHSPAGPGRAAARAPGDRGRGHRDRPRHRPPTRAADRANPR